MRRESDYPVFRCSNGNTVSYGDIVNALIDCGAADCDILFVHSDISFGVPVAGLRRTELKELLVDAILELGVSTVIFPTFTFSFCNKEDYNIQTSSTAMGMLPDYVRTRPDAIRTDDPILSVAILGNPRGFEKMTGDSSCGEGGIFHQLHNSGKHVKFLFFGTFVTRCFTYLHYVEEIQNVPYRYHKAFSGSVINNGESSARSVDVFVRYKGVLPTLPSDYESDLLEKGIMKKKQLGNSWVSAVDEKGAYDYITKRIKNNKYTFGIVPSTGGLIKEYEYGNVISM